MGTPVQLMRLLLVALLLVGCAGQPPSERMTQQEARLTPDTDPQTAPPEPGSAVDNLRSQALAAQAEGDWDKAAALLERALRLDGGEGDLYAEIAEVRLGQGRYAAAEQIALRGLTVSADNPERSARLWHAIAQSRSARGDTAGARQAREKAGR